MRRINLCYVHTGMIGYGRYGVALADSLARAGVVVDDHLNPDEHDPAHLACWISTPSHARGWFEGQRVIISTMWEATILPVCFREALHNFAQVIVPSEQNVEVFSKYHDNVAKVPLGFDDKQWHFQARKPPTRDFRFLIGGSGLRKGQDLAYKAFTKVFKTWPRSMPVPRLQFKSPRPVDYVHERIENIGGHISKEDEIDLYAAAHCYLGPARGEGFGLQPLQAIAQGLPTILTDAHGHAEYAHLGYGLSTTMAKAAYFLYGDAGEWWEPDFDQLCEYMEYVYYNYEEACGFAEMSSKIAHEQFTWDVCAKRFMRAIGTKHFEKPYEGTRKWTEPDLKKYLVRVRVPWAAEIAGWHYQFTPGKDYWETADLKRILYEAEKILDPSCVDADGGETDTGLTEEQLSRFGDYSANAEYCWTCHQKLGSGEMKPVPDI